MNTQISYMYRDGSNYKQHADVVIAGTLTDEQKKDIIDALDDSEHFIPSQVGLQDLQSRMIGFPSGDDHVWHELQAEDITETEKETTGDHSFSHVRLLAAKFKGIIWDVSKAMDDNGIML